MKNRGNISVEKCFPGESRQKITSDSVELHGLEPWTSRVRFSTAVNHSRILS